MPRLSGNERRRRRLAASGNPRIAGTDQPPQPRLETGEIHPDPTVVFADRHNVRLIPDGVFARILGSDLVRVNSLHGQGVLELGDKIIAEGVAEDGTIEAIRFKDARGFALGVQWHAEYDPQDNPVNRSLFQAFGAAVKAYKRSR
jgi:putative glutamine amidotransferase